VVSPYYVPGKESMAWIRRLSAAGVKMTLLTNSLAATDEPLVHAGYLRYRKDMLELGVEIFELSPTLARRAGGLAHFGESLGRLHAKVIVVDRNQLFVGSMNLDTRSERYNTELGVLMKGPALASDFLDLLEFEASAYRVGLNPQTREVEWYHRTGVERLVALQGALVRGVRSGGLVVTPMNGAVGRAVLRLQHSSPRQRARFPYGCGRHASSTTGFESTPRPSISTSQTSPAFMNIGGLRAKPTPAGVPEMMMSPG